MFNHLIPAFAFFSFLVFFFFSQERRTYDRNAARSNLDRSWGRIFFSIVNFVCWLLIRCPFHPNVTAVARKRPPSFCQSAGGRLHECTLDPTKSEWADHAAVPEYCGNLSGNELTRNLPGNIRPRSSQPAEPLWTDPDIKSCISVPELISTTIMAREVTDRWITHAFTLTSSMSLLSLPQNVKCGIGSQEWHVMMLDNWFSWFH